MQKQSQPPNDVIISQDEVIETFLHSLRDTIEKAKNVKKLILAAPYNTTLDMLTNYAALTELAFANHAITRQELLYFGNRGGSLGVPLRVTTFVHDDEAEDGEDESDAKD